MIPAGVSTIRAAACINWASSTGGYRYVAIKKNGSLAEGLPQLRVPAYAGTSQPMTVCSGKPISVAAGDVITVVVLQDSGGSINVGGLATNSNWLSLEAVS